LTIQHIIFWLYSCIKNSGLSYFSQLDKQEETVMLKTGAIDFPLVVVMDLQETYPEEVLVSEWNPAIAQLQLLKGNRREKKQSGSQLRLAVPEMDLPEHKA
jgi:hypothetical protein